MARGPRPAQPSLRHRRLAGPLSPGPCREPVPGPDRDDPLPAYPGRGDRRRQRRPLRAVRDPGGARRRVARGDRAVDPGHRILPHEGARGPPLRGGDPRAVRRDGAARPCIAHEPSRGRAEDRELRPRLRLRDPGDPGRHPRPPDREPPRPGPHRASGGDRGGAAADGRAQVLDPAEPAPGAARAEPVPADRPEVRPLPDRRLVRYGAGPGRGPPDAASRGCAPPRRARPVAGT